MAFVESRRFITYAADRWKIKMKFKRQAETRTMLSAFSHFFRSLNRIKCKPEWLCSKNMSFSSMVKDVVNSKRHRRKFWKACLPLNLGNKRGGDREYCHQGDCRIFSCGRHLSLPYWHQLPAMLPGLQQRSGSSHCFAVVSPQSHHSVWKLAFHVSTTENIIFSLTSAE